jgi:hypothetical protein
MGWLRWTGLALQVVGVIVSTAGIVDTWRDYAPPDRRFWRWLWAILRGIGWLWHELWKTRPPYGSATVMVGGPATGAGVAGTVTITATGEVTHAGTVAEQLAALAGRIDATNARLDKVHARVETEELARQTAVTDLLTRTRDYTREAMVGGLHLEAFGVFLVAVGIVLQGIELALTPAAYE